MNRKRVRRKSQRHSDSGLSSDSSCDPTAVIANNTANSILGQNDLPKIVGNNFNFSSELYIPLYDVCKDEAKIKKYLQPMDKKTDELPLFNIKITSVNNKRAVNGQEFIAKPEEELNYELYESEDDSILSATGSFIESDDEVEQVMDCSAWNRNGANYNLYEITSKNSIFENAELEDPVYERNCKRKYLEVIREECNKSIQAIDVSKMQDEIPLDVALVNPSVNEVHARENIIEDDTLSICVSNDFKNDLDDFEELSYSPEYESDVEIKSACDPETPPWCYNSNSSTPSPRHFSPAKKIRLEETKEPVTSSASDKSQNETVTPSQSITPPSILSLPFPSNLKPAALNSLNEPAISIVHSFCKRAADECNYKAKCRYFHEIPVHLESALLISNRNDLQKIVNYTMSYLKQSSVLAPLTLLIIKAFQYQKLDTDLLDLTAVILNYPIDKTPIFEAIMNALIEIEPTENTLHSVIIDILITHGRKNFLLLNILLSIVTQKLNFLTEYWPTIHQLLKYRTVLIDHGVATDILNECICIKQSSYHHLVTKEILLKPFLNINGIPANLLQTFYNELLEMDLKEDANNLERLLIRVGFLKTKELSDEEILTFLTCVKTNDCKGFLNWIRMCKLRECNDSMLTHLIAYFKRTDNLQPFHELLMKTLRSLGKDIGDLSISMFEIAFNTLPHYDLRKSYGMASELVIQFKSNLNMFLNCKVMIDIEPYKSNLKNMQERLVFIIKLLTRGEYFSHAVSLIKHEEFKLEDRSNHDLYKYKISVMQTFLDSAIKTDELTPVKDVIYYFLKTKLDMAEDLSKYFQLLQLYYGVVLYNGSMNDKENIFTEFKEFIIEYYLFLELNVLRGVFVFLHGTYELVPIYKYFIQKNIYKLQAHQDVISIKDSTYFSEIAVILKMVFISMVLKRTVPKAMQIVIVPDENTENEIPFLKTPNVDQLPMKMKVIHALKNFNPPTVVCDKLQLSTTQVKACLEEMRRLITSSMI